MIIVVFFISIWYLSLFSQTFLHHRYASHGAFKNSKGWERFFYVLAWLTQGSSYLSPRAYAIMHRMHHAYADTEKDPHSPSFSPNIFHMMWRTRNFYQDIYRGRLPVEERFTKNVPDWPAFDRFASSTASRLMWVILYTAFFVAFATSPWQYLLLPVVVATGPFHGAVVNWFAHKYGYKNYKLRNTAMNLLVVDFLMLGESYHNHHHKHPSDINFGKRWHEIDPVYPIIRLFAWLGIVQLPRLSAVPLEAEAQHHHHHH